MACTGKSNTTGGTSWAGTVNPSRAPKSTHILCCSIFGFLYSVLYIIVCPFVLFLLAISLSVLLQFTSTGYPLWYLRFTASDYLLWYLRFTASDYPLWYLRFMASDYPLWYLKIYGFWLPPFGFLDLWLVITPFVILDLRLLITPPLVSSNFSYNMIDYCELFSLWKYIVKPVLRGHLWDKENVAL